MVITSPRAHRKAILLVGDMRLRRILRLIAVPSVLTALHPLETAWCIEHNVSTLNLVVVPSALPWRAELGELLTTSYPEIRMVVVTT
jgi:hypothetical protein